MVVRDPLLDILPPLGDDAGHSQFQAKDHLNPLSRGVSRSSPATKALCILDGVKLSSLRSVGWVVAVDAGGSHLRIRDHGDSVRRIHPDVLTTLWFSTFAEEANFVILTAVVILGIVAG